MAVALGLGPVTTLDTVPLDTAHGSELIDAIGQLEKYRLVLDRMEKVSLEPAASRELIAAIKGKANVTP